MLKNENNKSVVLVSLLLIIFLMCSIVFLTYAIFRYSKEGSIKNVISTGNITFSYTETTNGITLDDALPISDEIGKKLEKNDGNNGYFDFNVSCTMAGFSNVFYEVYATKLDVEDQLDEKYVKIYLTDGTTDDALSGYDISVPTYDKLKKSIKNAASKQLYYGNFTSNGTQKFRLRMWISDEYMLVSKSEHFKIKVNVEANN